MKQPEKKGDRSRSVFFSLDDRLKIQRDLSQYALEYRKKVNDKRLPNYSLKKHINDTVRGEVTEKIIQCIIDGNGTHDEHLPVVARFLAKVTGDVSFLAMVARFKPSTFFAYALKTCIDHEAQFEIDRDI